MSYWTSLGLDLSRTANRSIKLFRLKRRILPVQVDGRFIEDSLKSFVPNYTNDIRGFLKGKRIKRHHLDSTYWTCTKREFQKIVEYNNINERKYIGQRFDCDNFAISFKGQIATDFGLNNVGIVIDNSGGHAYNIVVFSDGSVELFEPQNDGFPKKHSLPIYSFRNGIILL